MSILIKGMEMPTEGMVIAIYKLNDKFYASVHGTELSPLVSVPPHGRLIDADALKRKIYEMEWDAKYYPDKFMDEIVHAPTII